MPGRPGRASWSFPDRHRLLRGAGGPRRRGPTCCRADRQGAVAGGADLVQVREPDLDAGPHRLPAGCSLPNRRSRARVVVNDRADVALAVGAAGVHLPETSFRLGMSGGSSGRYRAWVVGRSIHSEAARQGGPGEYLLAGTVGPRSRSRRDWNPAGVGRAASGGDRGGGCAGGGHRRSERRCDASAVLSAGQRAWPRSDGSSPTVQGM
jgi:hypothetical protein